MRKEKDPFWGQIFKLTLPIVIQNLLSAAVSSADVLMLNYVGQASVSAVSLASQYANILFMVFFGLGSGATMLCAQYYGKKDMRAIQTVEGIAMRFSIVIAIGFASAAFFIPEKLMLLFTDDSELIHIGASYLRFISVSYLCWGITEVYLAVLRSIGKVTISTVMNVLAFSLNVVLNAVFIFGLFGMPKMGATGVAIATSLSRLTELAACIAVSAVSKDIKLSPRYLFVRNKVLFSDFIKRSVPALGNDILWSMAFSTYAVILGHLGTDAVAANSFVVVVRNFGTVLCFGLSSAGGILLGNIIGENRLDEAREDAKKVMKLTVITAALGGAAVLAASPVVLHYAKLTEQAMHYLKYMLIINSYYIMGVAVNSTLIAGVFRAGGDSRYGLVCDSLIMWVYAVPVGFLAAFVFRLPVMWVYFLMCTDEFAKWPLVLRHYQSGKWLNNITRDNLFGERDLAEQEE